MPSPDRPAAQPRNDIFPDPPNPEGKPPAPSAAQDRETALYEALLWISEYPNREHIYSEEDGVELAEFAREALNAYEASRV